MYRTRKIGNIGDTDSSGFLYYDSDSSIWKIISDSSLFNFENEFKEYIDGSLNNIRAIYIPDSSLSSDFYWNDSNLLRIDVSVAGSSVNPDLDYTQYQPFVGDVSFYYVNDILTKIITNNSIGVKTIDFIYDNNDDVSIMYINNYGIIRTLTFERDIEGNILMIHIV